MFTFFFSKIQNFYEFPKMLYFEVLFTIEKLNTALKLFKNTVTIISVSLVCLFKKKEDIITLTFLSLDVSLLLYQVTVLKAGMGA